MTLTKLPTKAAFEGYIDRDWRGSPIIWPEGTDPDAVAAWRASGVTVKDRDPKLRPRGGVAYARTTSYVDVVDDKTSLIDWLCRKTLIGATVSPDDLTGAVRHVLDWGDPDSPEGKRKLDRLVREAKAAADADLKTELGTMLHSVFEDNDTGRDVGFLPDEFATILQEYRTHTDHLVMVSVEQFGVQDTYKVAGTLDRLVWDERAQRLRVADVKSGSIVKHGKIARQIALYAHMSEYDPETFQRTPYAYQGEPVDQEVGLIIHTPSDGQVCNIYEVDIAAGWEGVALCERVKEERNRWGRKDHALRLVGGTEFTGNGQS